MRNVTKCLRAGVQQVLVLTVDPEKHQRLRNAVATLLSEEQQKSVLCLMRDDFEAFLDSLPPREPVMVGQASEGQPKMVKGWKVRTNAVAASNEDISDVEKELAATLGETLRRKRTKKREKK